MRAVKFPSQGTVFDYYIDPNTKKFTPWSECTPPYEFEPDVPLQVLHTHTHTMQHYYKAKLSVGNNRFISTSWHAKPVSVRISSFVK